MCMHRLVKVSLGLVFELCHPSVALETFKMAYKQKTLKANGTKV